MYVRRVIFTPNHSFGNINARLTVEQRRKSKQIRKKMMSPNKNTNLSKALSWCMREALIRTWKELPKKRDKDVITLYSSINHNFQILEVSAKRAVLSCCIQREPYHLFLCKVDQHSPKMISAVMRKAINTLKISTNTFSIININTS